MEEELPLVFVGRGIFGICGAIECARRMRNGKIICVGKRDEDASTFDISKITRGDYGEDELYTKLHTIALRRWKEKEKEWGMYQDVSGLKSLFHWSGVALLSRKEHPRPETSYESASFNVMSKLFPDVMNTKCDIYKSEDDVKRLLNPELSSFKSGYFNSKTENAGWIESGLVLDELTKDAEKLGVYMVNQNCERILENAVLLEDGRIIEARKVVVCCGAWTPFLIPETRALLTPTAQSVFLFETNDENAIKPWLGRGEGGLMGPTLLDIADTGFYMFPFHKRTGLLKIGHHGAGQPVTQPMTASLLRELEQKHFDEEWKRFEAFLSGIWAGFARKWKLKRFRLCQYCDSRDSHFLVDEIRPNVIVAAGGSGHGFKFGPCLGELIADKVFNCTNQNAVLREAADRFKWRRMDPNSVAYEKARNVPQLHVNSKM